MWNSRWERSYICEFNCHVDRVREIVSKRKVPGMPNLHINICLKTNRVLFTQQYSGQILPVFRVFLVSFRLGIVWEGHRVISSQYCTNNTKIIFDHLFLSQLPFFLPEVILPTYSRTFGRYWSRRLFLTDKPISNLWYCGDSQLWRRLLESYNELLWEIESDYYKEGEKSDTTSSILSYAVEVSAASTTIRCPHYWTRFVSRSISERQSDLQRVNLCVN